MADSNDNTIKVGKPIELQDIELLSTKYDIQEVLGSGRFGTVQMAVKKSTGEKFAAKSCVCRRPSQRKDVDLEIEIMSILRHPRLVNLCEAFVSQREVVLIMELITGGELFERIIDESFDLTEEVAASYLKQLCEAVSFMHANNILHLDLKPENVLCIGPENLREIKIIDFGFARKHVKGTQLKVMFGTPEFVAPEVVNFDPLGPGTDMWSIGVITYVLLSGLSPFMGDTDQETLSNVTGCEWDFDDESFNEISNDAKDFLEKLLVPRERDRMTCEQCSQHNWLTGKTFGSDEKKRRKSLYVAVGNMKKFVARRKWLVISTSLVDYLRLRAKDFQPVPDPSSSQVALNPLQDNGREILKENAQPNFSPVVLRKKGPSIESLSREDMTFRRGSILSLGSTSTTSFVSADEELASSDTAVEDYLTTSEEDFLSTEEFICPVKSNHINVSRPSHDRLIIPILPRDKSSVVSSDDEYFQPRPTTPTPGSDPPTFYEVTKSRSKKLFTRQETLGNFTTSSSEEMFTAESGSVTPVPAREDEFSDREGWERSSPKFLNTLEEKEVRLGGTCVLSCTILGYPTPQVAWYRNGIRIQPPIAKENSPVLFLASPFGSPYSASQRFKLFSEPQGNESRATECTKHSLTITDCRITDAGEYTVTAINVYGSVVTTAQLRISPGEGQQSDLSMCSPPEFILKLSDADGMIGCETTMACQVKGHPEPELIFYHKREEMTSERYCVVKDHGGRYTVVIRNLALEDEGEVRARAVNVAGFVECSAELFVDERILTPTPSKMGIPQWTDHSEELDPDMLEIHKDLSSQVIAPYFDDITDDVVTLPGASAVFVVRVYSWPAPSVQWYRKEKLLEESSKIVFGSTDFGSHTLTIRDVTTDDADVYTCVAANRAGSVSCKAELIVTADKDSSGSSADEKQSEIVSRKLKDHYVIHNDLGIGAFSITRLAREKSTGDKYAAKYIRCANAELRERYRSELSLLSTLSHPNIVSYHDVFETKKNSVLLMEYAEIEWFEHLLNKNVVYENEIAAHVRQLCCGLSYLHENNIIHLDLKPENVMMSEDRNTLKIIDFGSAQRIKKDDPVLWNYGNPEFVSPDVVLSLPATTSTDMWSIGVIVFVVLSGVSPFLGESDYATVIKVRKTDWTFDSKSFVAVSQISQDFISKLLIAEQSSRLSSHEALSHAWLQTGKQSATREEALPAGRLKYFLSRRKWQRSLVTPKTSLVLRPIPSLLAGEYDSTSVAVSRTAVSDCVSSSTVTESDDEVDDVTSDLMTPSFLDRISGLSEFNDAPIPKTQCDRLDSIVIENVIEQEQEMASTPVVKVIDSTPKSSPDAKRKCISASVVNEPDKDEHDKEKEDSKDDVNQTSVSPSESSDRTYTDEQMNPSINPALLSAVNTRMRLKSIGKKVSFEDQIIQEADSEEDLSPIAFETTLPQDLDESYDVFSSTPNNFSPKKMNELPPTPVSHIKPVSICEGVVIDRPQSVSKMLKEDKKHVKLRRVAREADTQSTKEKIKKKLSAMTSRRYRSFDLPDSSSSDEESQLAADRKDFQATSPKSKLSFFSWRRSSLTKGGSLDSSTLPTEPPPREPSPALIIKKAEIKGILKRGGSTDSVTQSDPHIQKSLKTSGLSSRRREAAYLTAGYQRKPLLKDVSLDLDKVEEGSIDDSVSKRTRSRSKHHSTSERRRLQMRRGSSAESALPPAFSRPNVGGLRGPLLEKDKVKDEDEPLAGSALRRSTPTVKGEIKHSRSYSGSLFMGRDRMSPLSARASPNHKTFSLSRTFFSRSIDVAAVQHAAARSPSFRPLPEQKSQSANLPVVSWSVPRSRSHDRFKPRRISNSDSRPLTDCYAPYLRVPLIDQGLTQEQSTATLACVIDASPLPEVTWYKNDDPIASDRFTAVEDQKNGKYQLKVDRLSLPEDFGEYSCEASNSAGIMKTSCTLKPAVIPEKPSAPELAGTDGRDVWVTWNPPTNCAASPITYTLQYREMAGMRWVNVDDSIEETLYRVSNLRLTTSYRFRVRASNNAGVGAFSKVSQRMQLDPKVRTESLEYTF